MGEISHRKDVKERYRVLGKTGFSVFEIGFGAWAIGGNQNSLGYGSTDDRSSMRAVNKALDLGCNFFDTADWYGHGHSESLLGKALQNQRKSVYIATKVGLDFYHGEVQQNYHPAYIRFALHESLRRLNTDYVDLYQLHNPPPEVFFFPDIVETLERLREQGKIRSIGVSVATIQDGIEAIHSGWPESIQIPYNMLNTEAEVEAFPLAQANQIGIIAREPLANGFLTGKYSVSSRFQQYDIRGFWSAETLQSILSQVELIRPYCRPEETMAQLAIRFVLERPSVSVVICGCKNANQVEENYSHRYKDGFRSKQYSKGM